MYLCFSYIFGLTFYYILCSSSVEFQTTKLQMLYEDTMHTEADPHHICNIYCMRFGGGRNASGAELVEVQAVICKFLFSIKVQCWKCFISSSTNLHRIN